VDRLFIYVHGPAGIGKTALIYHPATMLKIYVYGYINQIQSSRRLSAKRRAMSR
jgi:hypothetical protein